MAIPITNASAIPLSQISGSVPDMSDALLGWLQPMTFKRVTKTVVEFRLVETAVSTDFMGVLQPFKPQELQIKPEGQRSWSWFTIHALPGVTLIPDDVVTYLSVEYRVMQKLNYALYQFQEYHVVLNYTGDAV